MNEEGASNPQNYQVNVLILEGRHLALKDASTRVKVCIGKKKKTIRAKTNKTDSPYFNDFCVFQFFLPLNVLLDEILTIKVYQVSKLIRKALGSFNVELGTVWSQPNHQFYHKWAVLTDPKNPTGGVKGFIKCDIVILGKKTEIARDENESESEEILEENLLVPHGGIKDRFKTKITFSVFRADSFCSYHGDPLSTKISEPFVKITCGGKVRKTLIAKNKGPPVWNQELTFFDLFPPLYKSIFVEICDRKKPDGQMSLGNTNIDVESLYEGSENGFLPTFGPNFLYLYHPLNMEQKFARHKNCCTLHDSFTYICRLLLAMRTEILDFPEDVKFQKKLKAFPKSISPLIETEYFEYKKFILFAAIFDILFFDQKYLTENISIRITIGPKKNTKILPSKGEKQNEIKTDSDTLKEPKHLIIKNTCNTTPFMKCQVKEDYSFITFPGKFPCIHVFGEWPDLLRRMYGSNVIKKVIQNCTNEVNKIKYELEFENENYLEASEKLKKAMANLSKSCEVILLLTNVTNLQDTNLHKERKRVYHMEIAKIAEKTKLASSKSALKAEDELRSISTYLRTLTKYAQDPENTFPDTEIWLLKNDKIRLQYKIRTEDIAFSPDLNERGNLSGKTQSLIIRSKKQRIKAKLDMFVWFGLADDFTQCLKMLPSGFKHDHLSCPSSSESNIPTEILYEEAHHFQCRAHVFQAKIMFAFDNTGLADPFIRVIALGHKKVTQVRKATLSPTWNETLLFPDVTLYGPSEYIRENSITIIAEAFDKNKTRKPELIGKSFVKPVVKLKDDKYEPPKFPPKLKWEDIQSDLKVVGQILMVAELVEFSDTVNDLYSFESTPTSSPLSIPEDIRPHYVKHRLEILFWGVRQLKKKKSLKNKLFVTLEFGEKVVTSPVLKNCRHKLNFPASSIQYVELELPEEPEYSPPLSLKLFHIESITHKKTYVATCIVPSTRYFIFSLTDNSHKEKQKEVYIQVEEEAARKKEIEQEEKKKRRLLRKSEETNDMVGKIMFGFVLSSRYLQCKLLKKCNDSAYEGKPIKEDEILNWWIRYHASTEKSRDYPGITTLKVYKEELEAQPEFEGFTDFLYTFNMVKGQEKINKTVTSIAKVKAVLKLYKWDEENEKITTLNKLNPKEGLLSKALSNEPVKIVVRVYVVCGKNMAPKDISGKTDPYLHVQLGGKIINDRKNYLPKQLNPTFGKCFEFKGTLPWDSLLRVKVIDFDTSSKDDLIGETTIDIENRYYSKHHATCGLAKNFEERGLNAWRDIFPPTAILTKTCKDANINEVIYEKNRVLVEGHEFKTEIPDNTKHREQVQALTVLNKWHEIPLHGFYLVPEHVETRTLYNPSLPGIEQGKLEMWVDIFPDDFRYMPPKVDISPRPAIPMELRAIVWNVDNVILDDKSLFFSEKMSDIYVRGWILSLEEDLQKTDIHYRSLSGEGNFNWRFIFQFNYIPTERKMTVKKKMSAFDFHPEERKHDCKLEIQIWDNDALEDDYLGTLILELCSMPRGAKLSSRCTLKMLTQNTSKINLFKIRRTRGWWPFRRLKEKQKIGNEFELTGKIDLELEILTEAEARLIPAGKGREEPLALPPPIRPATSFNWMLSPWKTFRYIILKKMGRFIVVALIILILVFMVISGLNAFPNYVVKKLLRA